MTRNKKILKGEKKFRVQRRAAITAQSDNSLHDFGIFQNLVLNNISRRAEEIGTKIVKVQKFSS